MEDDEARGALSPLESFGVDVRQLRRQRQLTLRALGRATGYSESYVSKVETARQLPSERFAAGCDVAFGTGHLMAKARQLAVEGDHPTWFEPYIQLERRADKVFFYSTLYVPGLLQSAEYARAVLRAGVPRETAAIVEARVASRVRRRDLFEREYPAPPAVWVVLHEACLRIVVGDRGVMARQLCSLVRDAETAHITLQVMPLEAGPPAVGRAFTLMAFEGKPSIVYAEGPQGGRSHDAPRAVAAAFEAYDYLRAEALGRDASIARIQDLSEEYAHE
ncbi:helix-turn-helix domain-containing protein [Streptomyces sp. NPDC001889]